MPVADLKLAKKSRRFWDQMVLVALAVIGILVAGCSRPEQGRVIGPPAKILAPQPDLCNLVSLNFLIGKDFVLLADQSLSGTLRVIWPGQEISAEVIATRLNAQVSNAGLIEQLFCG